VESPIQGGEPIGQFEQMVVVLQILHESSWEAGVAVVGTRERAGRGGDGVRVVAGIHGREQGLLEVLRRVKEAPQGTGEGFVASGHSYWVSARSRRHTGACVAPRRAALGMAAGCTPRTGARGRPGWPRTSTQR
jgi:hypothetical protein